MSVTELKDRHRAVSDTVYFLRERLKQRRIQLLDTDGELMISTVEMQVYSLDWTPEKNRVISASQGGRLIVWNTLTSQKIHAIKLPCSWVMTCAFASNGQSVTYGGLDSVCSILNLNSPTDNDGSLLPVARTLSGHWGYMSSCQYVPVEDNHLTMGSGVHICVLWDISTGLRASIFGGEFQSGHTADVLSVYIGDPIQGSFCLVPVIQLPGYGTPELQVEQCAPTFHGHEGDANAVRFSPDRNNLEQDRITVLADCLISRHAANCKYIIRNMDTMKSHVNSIALSMSERLLFAGYTNGSCYVWDTLLGQVALDLASLQNSHIGRVSCLGCPQMEVPCVLAAGMQT
ncbi:hypothetical protein MLD38_027021 [Melastoma candidum]|uniref:Uncharacterized protein n=1 Tax=Melastoma candidum TaxID=119954 RepID=A0ACB9P3T5_9MYRT|nr:hypothetical protein MLD38_027021 [Melastoma candidum]